MRYLPLKISLFLFFFSLNVGFSQALLPFVENFTKSDYLGENQVWNVCQGSDNAMYFANNHLFLRYNGVKWERYTLPNPTIIRSVYAKNDKIYCGSYNEFGYWKRLQGKMHYTSLSKDKNLFLKESINEEIWKIFEFQGKLYFQSFNELFVYDYKTIKKIRIPFQISYCFPVDNQLFVASVREGLYVFEDEKFKPITQWNLLKNNVIHSVEKLNNQLYIFTQKEGVFMVENDKIYPWNHQINSKLKTELILTAKKIDNQRLAIGTASNGVYILDFKTNTTTNINRNNALKNNSVLNISLDKENDLWLGLDNGLSHIEINSPFLTFTDNSGFLGSVYSVAPFQEGYLLGSNHGVFSYINNQLKFINNTQGQVWNINKIDNQYVIGHNDGTFLFDGSSIKKINTINGGWYLLKSNFSDTYFQANYSGIVFYKSSNFSDFKTINNLTRPIKYIVQTKPNEIWAADTYKGLYKITLSSTFETQKIENITEKSSIKNDYEVKIFNYRNEVLFYINNLWYQYNSISNTLEQHHVFNTYFKNINQIVSIDDSQFLVIKKGLLYIISQKNNVFTSELIPEKYYKGKIVNHDIKVIKNNNSLIINLDDGFFTYQPHTATKPVSIAIEGFVNNDFYDNTKALKYNQPLEIEIISPYFGFQKSSLFYTVSDDELYRPITNGKINLTNLSSGAQKISIFHYNGVSYKKIKDYTFSVRLPWYFSIWMILLYMGLVITAFSIYYRWNAIRYNEKIKLTSEELKHKNEILQLELDAQNKLKIQEYEKHILEIQVQTKASEVAGKSLSIAKQSELIETIQKLLEKENDITQLKNNIKKAIKINTINKKEWETFENNLFKSHEEFVSRLSKRFPNLTAKDKKLCIYLKMNLTSKEIAPLMNISYRSVELHRYRLRKKLTTDTNENLSNFMNTI